MPDSAAPSESKNACLVGRQRSDSPFSSTASATIWPIYYKVQTAAACGWSVFNYSQIVFLPKEGCFAGVRGPGHFVPVPAGRPADLVMENAWIRGHWSDPDSMAGRVARGLEVRDDMEADDEGRLFAKLSPYVEKTQRT